MTARHLHVQLASSLVLFFLTAQSARATLVCDTLASRDRGVDCEIDWAPGMECVIDPNDPNNLCGMACGGNYQNTWKSDNVIECVREGALGGPYQCGDFQVAGDYLMEYEWVFENVPGGIQSLVAKLQLDPSSEEAFDFWYNINKLDNWDCVFDIPSSEINAGNSGQEVTFPISQSPLEAGRYRIRLFDKIRPGTGQCSDVWRDNIEVDLLRIRTEYNGAGMPDVTASSDYQTGPGTVLFGTSYSETLASDNAREQIRESLDGGVSKLSHTWRFTNVPSGCYRFVFEGLRTSNQESDNFQFSWAPDVGGSPGTFEDIPGAIINQTFEATGGLSVSFSTSLTGTIYIRVRDTNQMSGTSLDTLKIDFLAIRTQ